MNSQLFLVTPNELVLERFVVEMCARYRATERETVFSFLELYCHTLQ